MKRFSSIKNKPIKGIVALTLIAVTWINFNQERWKTKDVIVHDVVNYYSYLPAFFYEKDLSLSFLSDTIHQNLESRLYAPNHTADQKPIIKMSMGMSVTYLPFFGMAHVYSKLFDFPTNGFSEPYHFAILFSSLFYFVIGIIFLWKVMRMYFSERISSITLVCLIFGTNILYYLTIMSGMAHVVDFSLISAFLFFTIKWHQSPKLKTAVVIGCLGGFLVLIRPINALVFLFFFLYNIKSLQDFSQKIKMFIQHKFQALMILFCGFLIFLPQMLYWKNVTGSFLYNSYVGEHFYFNHPHVVEALFGFRKGWLIYTPMMLFSMLGFFFMSRHKLKQFIIPLTVFFLTYIYVAFSWWCWWYGGSFGQRALIDIYPLLAIPFAASLTTVHQQNSIKRKLVYSLIVFLIFLNLFQTIQAKYNILHYDSMTRENYFKIFFTITKKADREKYLQHPDYKKAMNGEDEN